MCEPNSKEETQLRDGFNVNKSYLSFRIPLSCSRNNDNE